MDNSILCMLLLPTLRQVYCACPADVSFVQEEEPRQPLIASKHWEIPADCLRIKRLHSLVWFECPHRRQKSTRTHFSNKKKGYLMRFYWDLLYHSCSIFHGTFMFQSFFCKWRVNLSNIQRDFSVKVRLFCHKHTSFLPCKAACVRLILTLSSQHVCLADWFIIRALSCQYHLRVSFILKCLNWFTWWLSE